MKKYVLMAILLFSSSFCFGTAIEYNKDYSTDTWRATKVFNGDVEIYESTPAATSNFEIKSGSITKVLNINASNNINVGGIVNAPFITNVKQIIFDASLINSLLWDENNYIFADIDSDILHLSPAHFKSYISITSSTSTYPSAGTGHLRLPFNADIQARNNIDSKDLSLLKVNALGAVQLGLGDNAEYMDVVVSSQLIVGGKTEDVGWGQILFKRDNTIMYSTTQFMGADTVLGDNLGNHIATTTLNMSDNYIINVFEIDGFNLETQFLEIANSTNTLVSVQEDTGTLRTDFATLALSTGTLKDYVDLIAESTGTLKTEIITVAEDTGTLRTDLIALALSTGTIIGDNLGNHIATMTLDMANNEIINLGGKGYNIADQFEQIAFDTSSINISGDNLGNHIATTTLNMSGNYAIDFSSINFDGGTWLRGEAGKIIVEGGELNIDESLVTNSIEGFPSIDIKGVVSISTLSILTSGKIDMNNASVLNVSSITFQDGTYISSSPFQFIPAGGGGGTGGVTVATFSYTFLCSDPAMSSQNTSRFPAIMGTGFSCYEIVESTWYITGVRATAIIKSTISACSFELTYSSMTDWTTFEEFGTTKLSPTFDIISEQIHIDTDSWRSDWVVPSKTTIKPNEALSFLISQVPPSNDAAKNILIEIRYWRKLDE